MPWMPAPRLGGRRGHHPDDLRVAVRGLPSCLLALAFWFAIIDLIESQEGRMGGTDTSRPAAAAVARRAVSR